MLREVTLEIQRGESVAIVGPSGSGKSTLLNIMGTLDRPRSGQVLLDGRELSQLDDNGYGKRRWIVVQEFGPYTNHLSDRERR